MLQCFKIKELLHTLLIILLRIFADTSILLRTKKGTEFLFLSFYLTLSPFDGMIMGIFAIELSYTYC